MQRLTWMRWSDRRIHCERQIEIVKLASPMEFVSLLLRASLRNRSSSGLLKVFAFGFPCFQVKKPSLIIRYVGVIWFVCHVLQLL